jgi:hypothetical protein
MRERRKRIWIDGFQTRLFLRIGLYFVLYQVAVWAAAVIGRHVTTRLESALGEGGAAFCQSLLLMGVVLVGILFLYDAVIFSHRVVGPLYRFRQVFKAIAAGEEVSLIRLRKRDYLVEMQNDFNEMLQVLEQRGAIVLKPATTREEEKEPAAVC